MNLLESVRSSATEIWSHKLRSLLTLLGIVLGTTAVVVMSSVIGGAAKCVKQGFEDLGWDGVMLIGSGRPTDRLERKKDGYSRGLRSTDLTTIDEGRALLQGATPVVESVEVARLNGHELRVHLGGITPEYGVIRKRGALVGRYLLDRDVETHARVAVIGQTLREQVYGTENPIGREIVMRGLRFQVVGVVRALGNSQVNDDDMRRDNSKVYIPLTTMQMYFTGGQRVDYYLFKVRDLESMIDGEKEATALLRRSHHGISDFRVWNIGKDMVRFRAEADKLIANWTVVLTSIAGISLLVGGIGIFSVMQISISERVYEIGLRKSIGATDGAIFGQFLIESVSLSVLGGMTLRSSVRVVLEHHTRDEVPERCGGLRRVRERSYGETRVSTYTRSEATDRPGRFEESA